MCKLLKFNYVPGVDPVPRHEPDDILMKLGRFKMCSSFDASRGYWATPIEEDTKDSFTFVTERDCYRFRVMPFGCSGASAFHKPVLRLILGVAGNLDHFVDNMVVYTLVDFGQLLRALKALFERVRRANIKLRPAKAKEGYNRLSWLGFDICKGQITTTHENVVKVTC